MKLLVLKKKSNDINWSDSLELLNCNLSSIKDVELYNVNIGYNFFNNYMALRNLSKNEVKCFDVIVLHHAITFYFCFFFLFFFKTKAKIFFAHEGEIHLGWKYAFKNKQLKNIGSLLRYSKLWNKLPSLFFDYVYVLSGNQSRQFSKSKVVHFLGVDESTFNVLDDVGSTQGILFPANINRFEKGWHLLSEQSRKDCFYPCNTPNNEMPFLYNKAKIVVIPSVYETYCIALVEALFCNKVVITTRNVGLASDLLRTYGYEYLREKGLFVFDNIEELNKNLQDIYVSNIQPDTRDLAFDNNLSSVLSARNLYSTFLKVI